MQSRTLTNEQRHLVRDASLSSGRVVCVAGVAGAGKTTALRVLADAHRESDLAVVGAALSGRAADELAAATGIRASTLHRLLLDAPREGGLPRRCLLVVDEAGMAETRVLAPLLRLVEQADGKALLVGDPGQLWLSVPLARSRAHRQDHAVPMLCAPARNVGARRASSSS